VPLPRKLLGEDEDVVVELRPHWVFFVGPLAAAAATVGAVAAILIGFNVSNSILNYFLFAVAAVPVLWFLGRLLRWSTYIVALTTTRIIVRRGVFERDTLQLRLQRVTEVNTSQALWERALGTGRLIIDIQGDDDSLVIEDVTKPAIFQRVINTQIDELVNRHRTDLVQGGEGGPTEHATYDSHLHRIDHPNDTPPFGTPVIAEQVPLAPMPRHAPPTPGPAPAPASGATQDQIRDRLIELDDLRQRGILSEQEFATKKAELLNRI
jgi:membrane protein YdbS with pleckstrin-like domain